MFRFENQRVIVFGGSAGIGLATARLAAQEGASVSVISRSRTRVDAALELLPTSAEGYTADLSDEPQVQSLVGQIGAFDHLVYTAGESLSLSILEHTDLTAARGFLGTRLWGALAAVKHGARQIKPGGSIVLMSGSAATRPRASWTVAAAICGAMNAIVRALAVELAPIRVNAVSPGIVRTDLWSQLPVEAREAMYATAAEQLPVRRAGEADDVAQAIAYLMSNGYTTGISLEINGGSVLV